MQESFADKPRGHGFASLPISELTISEDIYRPLHRGFDEGSAWLLPSAAFMSGFSRNWQSWLGKDPLHPYRLLAGRAPAPFGPNFPPVAVEEIARLAGHASIKVTETVNRH
jgi:hypothetical protein